MLIAEMMRCMAGDRQGTGSLASGSADEGRTDSACIHPSDHGRIDRVGWELSQSTAAWQVDNELGPTGLMTKRQQSSMCVCVCAIVHGHGDADGRRRFQSRSMALLSITDKKDQRSLVLPPRIV